MRTLIFVSLLTVACGGTEPLLTQAPDIELEADLGIDHEADAGTLTPDTHRAPRPDIHVEVDASVPGPDSSPVEPDASPVEQDSSVEPDASPVEPDASSVEPDASPVEPDSSPVEPDASPVEPDASEPDSSPTPDAGVPDTLPPDAGPLPCTHPAVVQDCVDDWCIIPAGCFDMGSPTSEPCRNAHPEKQETRHEVRLTRSFEIGQTEVTTADWDMVMDGKPYDSLSTWPKRASWSAAVSYCNKLSSRANLPACYVATTTSGYVPTYTDIYDCPGYRLPTEAEWEYAYRAGTVTSHYSGAVSSCISDAKVDSIGWYRNTTTSSYSVKRVGTKAPNDWGLYDMAGNMEEWTHDLHVGDLGSAPDVDPQGAASGTTHTLRGGYTASYARFLRASSRHGSGGHTFTGFRCARTL